MKTQNRILSRYFADTPEDLSAQAEATSSIEGLPKMIKNVLVGMAVLLTGFGVVAMVKLYLGTGGSGPKMIALTGADARQLKPDAKVMFGNEQIGRVSETRIIDGQPVAMLTIDPNYSNQLTAGHEFKVGSLNRILPGNVGVKVSAPEGVALPAETTPASVPLRSGSKMVLNDSPMPVNIPVLFYALVGIGVLGFVGMLVVSKLLKPLIVLVFLLVLIAGALFVLQQRGIVDLPVKWETQTGVTEFAE